MSLAEELKEETVRRRAARQRKLDRALELRGEDLGLEEIRELTGLSKSALKLLFRGLGKRK